MSYWYTTKLIYGIKIDKCVDEVNESELDAIATELNTQLPKHTSKQINVHLTGDYVSGHDLCYYIGISIDLCSVEINNSSEQLNEFVKQYNNVLVGAKLYNTYTYL